MINRLDRLWRSFGAGLFLSAIGLGGSVLALTVFPLIALATPDRERRRRRIQAVMHRSLAVYCRAIHLLRMADVEMIGTERLRGLHGTLIIANHPSLLDVVMIMAALPNVQCVVKGGLWRNPFFRLTVEGAGYIRNDQPAEALVAACVATLKAGNNLIIFPEGTRTRPGCAPRFQRGFATIAVEARADIQLIRLHVDPPLLHKGQPWWQAPPTRTRFRMHVCGVLDTKPFCDHLQRSISTRRIVSMIERFYVDECWDGTVGGGAEAIDRPGAETGGLVA